MKGIIIIINLLVILSLKAVELKIDREDLTDIMEISCMNGSLNALDKFDEGIPSEIYYPLEKFCEKSTSDIIKKIMIQCETDEEL